MNISWAGILANKTEVMIFFLYSVIMLPIWYVWRLLPGFQLSPLQGYLIYILHPHSYIIHKAKLRRTLFVFNFIFKKIVFCLACQVALVVHKFRIYIQHRFGILSQIFSILYGKEVKTGQLIVLTLNCVFHRPALIWTK